jgi:hypothetical protein
MAAQDGSQSGGSLIGGIIGATLGFFLGGPAGAVKGFVYGSTIGGILVPPSGPDLVGPRLDDLSVQTSSNVADIPRIDGTMGLYGNLIWAQENQLQEVITSTTQKKKLLGFTVSKIKTTTYTYYLNCAIAFALMDEGDDATLLRLWVGDKLVLNRSNDDVGTMLASGDFAEFITFYKGTDDQAVDPNILADLGAANASAWPGLCYLVIKGLDLSPWNDSAARAAVKAEISSGGAVSSGLEFISQMAAPKHAELVHLYDANFLDQEGLHVWKLATQVGYDLTVNDQANGINSAQDFDKYHYISIPGAGGYLKEKITDITPSRYALDSFYECKTFRHTAKGKSDINAAVFVTVFSKPTGDADGGEYHHPILDLPGLYFYPSAIYGCDGDPAGAVTAADSMWQVITDVLSVANHYGCPGFIDSAFVFDAANQWKIPGGIQWKDGAGAGYGFLRFGAKFSDLILDWPDITSDMFSSTSPYATEFSVTLVTPSFVKEFKIPATTVPINPISNYCFYQGNFYWGYSDGNAGHLYKINVDGVGFSATHEFSDVSNPVHIVRIGVVNDELCVITRIGTTPTLRIGSLAMGDYTTYTDHDSAAILAAFGFTGQDFIDNTAMDQGGFVYYRAPNVYRKTTIDAAEELLGDASADFITGADKPEFLNMWIKDTLLAVSTYGGSLPETGVQFFNLGSITDPGSTTLQYIFKKYAMLAGVEEADIDVSMVSQIVRGHRVAKRGSVRNVLEQLRGCWPFDVIMSGYQIKVVPRGQSSVATISYLDLGPGVQWVQDREMSTQLPRKIIFRYLDRDLEYETNEQISQRPIDSNNDLVIEIPIVFSPDEGAERADILHSIFLIERKTFTGFVLPPTYRHLEPADVITVEFPDASYQVRLTNLNTMPDGSIRGDGKENSVPIYTSTAKGSTRTAPVSTIPVAGAAFTVLMDLPVIDAETMPGFTAVMASVFTNWRGGDLYRTKDNDVTWTPIAGYTGACTFGVCANALLEHDGVLIDRGSELTVKMYAGTAPASVTETQFLDETTLVAYGANTRWEIIAFQNVTTVGDSLVYDTLIRGMRGTEWATGLHEVGDYFVLLTDDDNAFIQLLEAEIGTTVTTRGVSRGADFGAQFNSTLAYEGENLLPLSPVHASVELVDEEDLHITVVRRDREGAPWPDYIDAPMSEAALSLELDILAAGVTVRTLTSLTETFIYTRAQQLVDFLTQIYTVDIAVAQVSLLMGRGRLLYATVSVTEPGYYPFIAISHATTPFISVYPWNDAIGFGVKFADPSVLSASGGSGVAIAPHGAAILHVSGTTPFLEGYQFNGVSGFGSKYSNPSTVPTAGRAVAIAASGDAVALASSSTPYIHAYPFSSSTGFGVKFSNPAVTLGTTTGYDTAFSPTGGAVVLCTEGTERIVASRWNDTTGFGVKYSAPATVPTARAFGCDFSPSGLTLAVGNDSAPNIAIYPWTDAGGFGVKFSNPATFPGTQATDAAFSPNNDAVAFASIGTPFFAVYPWDDVTGIGVKYSNPATLPTGRGDGVKFSKTGGAIAVAHTTSPYVSAYPFDVATGIGVKFSNPATLPAGTGNDVDFF